VNRLAGETSPYLRQHRDNPVDWYPWGDEAFARARELDRPLLVSIGYSSCHWCHVMAHESFEDETTAAAINERFVAVKVDREERPDVDAVYMDAVQALTGGGGWPLTVFVDPDGRPFFGGTYFPKVATRGMAAFSAVLDAVAAAWADRRGELEEQAARLTGAVGAHLGPPPPPEHRAPGAAEALEGFLRRFGELYDPDYGGIGRAPKFPQPPMLELALRAGEAGNAAALEMVLTTLAAMASGGIYDHVGGGFARYSTDRIWLVPHFEKMLYDQAGLARLYLHAYQVTGDPRWRQVTEEILDYVLSDLRDADGGISSAEDADSAGEEGLFYTWTSEEFDAALPDELRAAARAWYGVGPTPNFEGGRSILHRPVRGDLVRPAVIEAARRELHRVRSERERPGLDDKVLTEWNAMTVAALAETASVTGDERYRAAAVEVAEFLLRELRRPDGRWLRSYQSGRAAHLGLLGDYAWMTECLVRVAECTGESRWLEEAETVAEAMLALFSAPDGGFYLSGADAPALVVRPRDTYDGVVPAAGSAAAGALARLGAITGNDAYLRRAEHAVAGAAAALESGPIALPHLIGAALTLERGALEIVIAGDRPDLVDVVRPRYLPESVLAWGEPGPGPLWEGRDDDRAYVCRGGVCLAPVSSADDLLEAIVRARAETRT